MEDDGWALLHRIGVHGVKIAEGRSTLDAGHEVRLVERRQLANVVEPTNVPRLDALAPPEPAIERRLPGQRQTAPEAFVLQFTQRVAANRGEQAYEIAANWIFPSKRGKIQAADVGFGVHHCSRGLVVPAG